MFETGTAVFCGLAFVFAKLRRRTMLRLLNHDLLLDVGVSLIVLAIHWGTFSGVMAATVAVNLAPENPYLANAMREWPQGYFLNFNGLTRLVSQMWPFAALFYLMLLAPSLGREPEK